MPLEDLDGPDKYLNALNKDWPLDDDPRPEGDNHIRGFKNVILNTFGSLNRLYDLTKAIFYNEPASGQPTNTGSQPSAVGTTAQRPENPIQGAWRLNTDINNPSFPLQEFYIGNLWRQQPLLQAQALWENDQYFKVVDAAEDPANAVKLMFGKAIFDQWGRMYTVAINDDPGGYGRLIFGVRNNGSIFDLMSLDNQDGLQLNQVPKIERGGRRILEQQFVSYEATPVAFSLGQVVTFTHGLGWRPKLYKAYLVSTEPDGGFATGTEVEFGTVCATNDTQNNFESAISTLYVDQDTTLKLRISNRRIAVANSSGGFHTIDVSKWQVFVRAWA